MKNEKRITFFHFSRLHRKNSLTQEATILLANQNDSLAAICAALLSSVVKETNLTFFFWCNKRFTKDSTRENRVYCIERKFFFYIMSRTMFFNRIELGGIKMQKSKNYAIKTVFSLNDNGNHIHTCHSSMLIALSN